MYLWNLGVLFDTDKIRFSNVLMIAGNVDFLLFSDWVGAATAARGCFA